MNSVSALLHAVAVVKVGVFSIVRTITGVFGTDVLQTFDLSTPLLFVAATTILVGSFIALSQDNLKRMLAFSTIAQLSYIVLGAALLTPKGVTGGMVHIAMHAFGKITLFFCAGAVYTATKFTQISQLDGLGRQMPFTFSAYLIAAVSIIGLPPLVGSWSKWFLIEGSISIENYIVLVAFGLSTLLNCAYLLPIALRAFFKTPGTEMANWTPGIKEAPLACVVPLCLTALATLIMFFFIQPIYTFLAPVFIQ